MSVRTRPNQQRQHDRRFHRVRRDARAPIATIERPARSLTSGQIEAVRAVMHLFVEDDIANGVSLDRRLFCDACQTTRPMAGFIRYERHAFCNDCAVEYEVAQLRGWRCPPGSFIRDKQFGDDDAYALHTALLEATPA